MELFILLKGYDYEGYGTDVEVFTTLEEAETRKQAYRDGTIQGAGPGDTQFDYGYDSLKIVKRTLK